MLPIIAIVVAIGVIIFLLAAASKRKKGETLGEDQWIGNISSMALPAWNEKVCQLNDRQISLGEVTIISG